MENGVKRNLDDISQGTEETETSEIVSVKRRRDDLHTELVNFGYEGNNEDLNKLSKRYKKKLLKQLKTQKNRPIRRKEEKARRKAKRLFARLNNIDLGPSRKALKNRLMATSICKVTIVIDFSYDDLMSETDMRNCIKQLNRCYCANRRIPNPIQFHVTNFNGKAKEVLSKYNGFRQWDVRFHTESYLELFDKPNLVFLTSDSENVIDKLEESKTYIIGGLVDHNSHKNLCYRVACDQGIAHGRLPIDEFVEMKTRKVLAINHVFEIMLHVSGGMTWKDAFLRVIPLRKGAVEKIRRLERDLADEDEKASNNDGGVPREGGNYITRQIERGKVKAEIQQATVTRVHAALLSMGIKGGGGGEGVCNDETVTDSSPIKIVEDESIEVADIKDGMESEVTSPERPPSASTAVECVSSNVAVGAVESSTGEVGKYDIS